VRVVAGLVWVVVGLVRVVAGLVRVVKGLVLGRRLVPESKYRGKHRTLVTVVGGPCPCSNSCI